MSKKKRLIGLLYIAVLCSQGLIGLLYIAVLCSQGVCAQTRQMGIEELFRLADEQSKSIQTYRTGREASEEALKAAKAQRLPDVNVSLSASYWGNGKLWDRDFSNAMTVDMPHFGNNFALEAQQVIYAGGAINSGIKQAEIGKALAELDLRKNVQEIRFLLVGHYLNLYKLDNQIKVLQRNMQLTEEVIANMKARREQGTVLKNDITRYELQKEQLNLQLTRVKDARRIANHQLVTILHLPESTEKRAVLPVRRNHGPNFCRRRIPGAVQNRKQEFRSLFRTLPVKAVKAQRNFSVKTGVKQTGKHFPPFFRGSPEHSVRHHAGKQKPFPGRKSRNRTQKIRAQKRLAAGKAHKQIPAAGCQTGIQKRAGFFRRKCFPAIIPPGKAMGTVQVAGRRRRKNNFMSTAVIPCAMYLVAALISAAACVSTFI